MTFYCACFPHHPQSFSPSLPMSLGSSFIFANIFFHPRRSTMTFSLTFLPFLFLSSFRSISHNNLSLLSLFLSLTPNRPKTFLKLPFDAIRASYIHPRPFVFLWSAAISWRINCFVSFWYERRMNGTSSWCFFYYFVCSRRRAVEIIGPTLAVCHVYSTIPERATG